MPYHVSISELHEKGFTYQSSKIERVKNANAGKRILICMERTSIMHLQATLQMNLNMRQGTLGISHDLFISSTYNPTYLLTIASEECCDVCKTFQYYANLLQYR